MRPLRLLLLLSSSLVAFFPFVLSGQTAADKNIQCDQLPADTSEGARAFAAGDFVRAESSYSGALSIPSVTAYIGLVNSQIELNHLSDALASAQKAAAALPASADAQALVGDALQRAGQIPEASIAYAKALALNRCSAIAHFGSGRLNELLGHHATAARELNIAHRLAPAAAQITAAVIETVPTAQRIMLLSQFIAQHPTLPPGELDKLAAEEHQLEQHQTCSPTAEFTTAEIPLNPVMLSGRYVRSWGIKLAVNDEALPLLELDSSVTGILLNPKDAERAGVARTLAGTGSPTPDAPYSAVAKHIRIGNLDFHDCVVTVTPSFSVDGQNSLIGTDFFRDHLIHIDYVAHLLSLQPLPAPGKVDAVGRTDQVLDPAEKAWTQVYIAGSKVLVPTLVNKKGPYLFVLDTGVGSTVYSPQFTRRNLGYFFDTTVNLRGSSSAFVKVIPVAGGSTEFSAVYGPDGAPLKVGRPVKLPVLRFALSEIPDESGVSFDITALSHDAHTEISGLLGFHLMSYFDIEINYRDALVRIAFDQNRRYHVTETMKTFY